MNFLPFSKVLWICLVITHYSVVGRYYHAGQSDTPPPRKLHWGQSGLVNLCDLGGHLCVLGKRKEKISYTEKEARSRHRGENVGHCSARGVSQEPDGILVPVLVCSPLWSMEYLNGCFQLILHLLLNHFERLWFLTTKWNNSWIRSMVLKEEQEGISPGRGRETFFFLENEVAFVDFSFLMMNQLYNLELSN